MISLITYQICQDQQTPNIAKSISRSTSVCLNIGYPHICMVQNLMFPLKLANLGVLSDIFRDINHQIVGRLYPTIITYIYIYYIILLSIIPHYVVLFLASHGCWWNPPPMFGYVWIIAINSWGTRAEAAERHHGPGLRWKCSHNMCLWTLFTIYFTYLYRLYLCIFHLMHCIIYFLDRLIYNIYII